MTQNARTLIIIAGLVGVMVVGAIAIVFRTRPGPITFEHEVASFGSDHAGLHFARPWNGDFTSVTCPLTSESSAVLFVNGVGYGVDNLHEDELEAFGAVSSGGPGWVEWRVFGKTSVATIFWHQVGSKFSFEYTETDEGTGLGLVAPELRVSLRGSEPFSLPLKEDELMRLFGEPTVRRGITGLGSWHVLTPDIDKR